MRNAIIFIFGVLLTWAALAIHIAQAADIELQWEAPTTNEDGSALDDLAGYRIYRSQQSGTYPTTPIHTITGTTTSYSITDHPTGIHFYTITAVDADGNESQRSNEVSYNVSPGPPTNLTITITIQVP